MHKPSFLAFALNLLIIIISIIIIMMMITIIISCILATFSKDKSLTIGKFNYWKIFNETVMILE